MHKQRVAKYLKKYVKDFKSDQVSSNLLSGEFELRNVELLTEPINAKLVGVLPYTLAVEKVVCESLHVSIPWAHLRSKSLKVRVGGCHAHVKVHQRADMEWLLRAVKAERDHMVKIASRADAGQETEAADISVPPMKLQSLKVAIADGLVLTIASLDLVILSPRTDMSAGASQDHHKEMPPQNKPVRSREFAPALKLRASNISLAPCGPDSRVTDRPSLARQRIRPQGTPPTAPPSLTMIHRRLAIGSLEVSCAACTVEKCPVRREMNLLVSTDISVSLLEIRALGQLTDKASAKESFLMCGFPGDVRATVELPHVEVKACCHRLGALAALAREAAAPSMVPLEELPLECRYLHWSHPAAQAEIEEAAQAQKQARRWKAPKDAMGRRKSGGSKAAAVAAKGAGVAAGAVGQVARMSSSGAIKTARVSSTAIKTATSKGVLAAKGASGAAVVAQRKGLGALATVAAAGGRAAASGRAAAGKATKAAKGTKQAATTKAVTAAGNFLRSGSGKMSVPWKRSKLQLTGEASMAAKMGASGAHLSGEIEVSEEEEEEEIGESALLQQELEEEQEEEDFAAADVDSEQDCDGPSEAASEAKSAREVAATDSTLLPSDAVDDGSEEFQDDEEGEQEGAESESSLDADDFIDEEDLRSLADDGNSEALDDLRSKFAPVEDAQKQKPCLENTIGSPPALTKRIAVHVVLTAAHAVLHGTCGEEVFLADIDTVDITTEDVSRLSVPELRGMEAMKRAPPGAAQSAKEKRDRDGDAGSGNSLGGKHCITVGSVRVSYHGVENMCTNLLHCECGLASPWLLALRCSTPAARPGNRTPAHIQGCLHGIRSTVAPEASKAIQSVLEEIQSTLGEGVAPGSSTTAGDPAPAAAMHHCSAAPASQSSAVAVPPVAATPSLVLPEVSLLMRDVGLELLSDDPSGTFRVVLPGLRLVSAAVAATSNAAAGRSLWEVMPAVPTWHSRRPPPHTSGGSRSKGKDLNLYSYLCSGYDNTAVEEDTMLIAERQWRWASDANEPSEILVPASDFLHLSEAKLRLAELTSECNGLSEKWHASILSRIASETTRRIPMVRELLEESVAVADAQLEALQEEARALESERQTHLAALRSQEKQTAASVGDAHAARLEREADLKCRLEEECEVTAALAALVSQQAALLKELQQR